MGSRISPADNSVLLFLKSQPITDKILKIPIPIPILTVADELEAGGEKLPAHLITESEPDVMVRTRGESMGLVEPAVAEGSNWAVQMAIAYNSGGRKMKTVIPKKRKLVKTMMYHSIKDFVISLFRLPPSADAGAGAPQ